MPSNRLQLVHSKKRNPKPPNTRLNVGPFIADIFVDSRSNATVYHWIVQRIGSAEIIAWSQENSFEDAERRMSECLDGLMERENSR
jgi:hypothetical protein